MSHSKGEGWKKYKKFSILEREIHVTKYGNFPFSHDFISK